MFLVILAYLLSEFKYSENVLKICMEKCIMYCTNEIRRVISLSKSFIKRIVCFAFAALLMFSQYAAVYGFSNVTVAKSSNDYAKICADIVNNNSKAAGNSSPDAVDSVMRIIGKTLDINYNFASLNAKTFVVAEDGRFLMQFGSYESFLNAFSKLSADSVIIYAQPDSKISTASLTESQTVPWTLECIGIDKYSQALSENSGLGEVTVAVVDTGIADIATLEGRLVDGYDFVENDNDAFADESADSHGTFIAGIIAECTENTNVNIMPVRVIKSKTAYVSTVINGIYYAVDNGAQVVNVSMQGAATGCTAVEEAFSYAASKDVAAVVSAGNTATDTKNVCPAHIQSVITVSSIDNTLTFAGAFSNYGEHVDVCAPGVGIISYGADGNQKALSGTSMSAAFISAGAALLRMQNPNLSSEEVQAKIKESCLDLGAEGFDVNYGYGLPQFDCFIDDAGNEEIPEEPVIPTPPVAVGISIKTPPSKIEYTYKTDSELDVSGLVIEIVYSDSTRETVTDLSKVNVSGYDSGKAGEQRITVEYDGFTAQFSVIVEYAWWQWIIRILLLGFIWY